MQPMTAIQNTPDRVTPFPTQPTRRSSTRAETRLGIALAWLALLFAGLALVLSLIGALTWRTVPFVGALFTRNLVVDGTQPLGGFWEGLGAGLQRGDQIIALGEQPIASPAELQAALAQYSVGESVRVSVLRPTAEGVVPAPYCAAAQAGNSLCTLTVPLDTLPDNDFAALFVIPFLAGVVAFAIGAALLALRAQVIQARYGAFICALVTVFCTSLFDLNTSYALAPFWIAACALLAAAIPSLALLFPVKHPALFRNPALLYLPMGVALVTTVVCLALYLSPIPLTSQLGVQIAVLLVMVGVIAAIVLWQRQRQRATSPLIRDQASLILVGFLFALMPGVIWLVNIVLRLVGIESIVAFNTSAIAPFFAIPIFSVGYTLLQTRGINADQWISRGITYTFLALGLILGYFMLVLSATLLTGNFVAIDNPVILALFIFFIAALFVPIRTYLQSRIDRLYFRQRMNYQNQVEQFARDLSALRELRAIAAEYRGALDTTLAPTHTFIFLLNPQTGEYSAFGNPKPETDIRFVPDSALVRFLKRYDGLVYLDANTPWSDEMVAERARLMVLKPLIIAGFRGSSTLSGFAVIGAPRSGAGAYDFDQQRFIENLTNQMTIAVERAQTVESLERRVRELNVLSHVSQTANFTGDMDTLLELISSDTLKLIEASHVYIALRDPAMNELYYVFFQEHGERHEARENQRWTIGSDVISDVIRTVKPLRVPSFVRAMAERNVTIEREDPALTAWMGVPLVTGTRALGVLAVGMVDANRPFGEDQQRLLGDIGALAATSLDNARLFTETNLRARQLSTLNDISRKLVATELNLDNLLQIITQSATDILNAEAGSLLLTTDDGTGDLEFKVDIGSPGVDLVGTRVRVGKGLVGEVASSGKPLIVNDVVRDANWAKDFDTARFVTRNVLATPLITQNRVIGVLEIVNRRNGVFTQDDIELVTTFASQAAVAIENARLFQTTDQQLRDRLDELEVLERIDAEMNRSLDLQLVAETALRYAVTTSGATAGVIGLVESEGGTPYLRVIAQIGYSAQDYPPESNEQIWSLASGIASRALRTRRAELVSDVSMDPMYVPSLRNGRSQITVPMLSGGEITAMLVLESNRETELRLSDMPFVQRLAEHASIAIANAQLVAQLARANQSKSEFVSFVAHELKNPLTSIKGYADVLINGVMGGLSEQQRGFIGTIRSNAERMNTLVSDLNDVTKLQTNNLRVEQEGQPFIDIVEETLRPLQQLLEEREQRVALAIPTSLPDVYVDRNRIIQVLTNMISNAHKYSPANTTITIAADIQPPQRNSKGQVTRPMLHVRVKDEGIGMSEEDLAKLFTPYFRSENPLTREQPGTGLGLTITRGIIERHEGSVWVESEMGSGTTFHFTIPLVN
jgi:signal transduction histidine kinase